VVNGFLDSFIDRWMRAILWLLAVSLLALGCRSSPPPALPTAYVPDLRTTAFQSQRAWADLARLTEIGPRVIGSQGNADARAYILEQLLALDLHIVQQKAEVQRPGEDEPVLAVNLAARIEGTQSQDVLMLAAPYDTQPFEEFRFVGANDGASGAAVLLELTRVLAANPLPYRVWVVFLDGEAAAVAGEGSAHAGSTAVIRRVGQRGLLPSIRLAVVVNRVCDPDLQVARDQASYRIYREEFWHAARWLGESDAFPPRGEIEMVDGPHQGFVNAGMKRVVALMDTRFGGGEPPGIYAGTEDDDLEHCSADSLATVGRVILEGLYVISRRLAKIDRFSESPVEGSASIDHLIADPNEDDETPQAGDEVPPGGGEAVPPGGGEAVPPESREQLPPGGAEDVSQALSLRSFAAPDVTLD